MSNKGNPSRDIAVAESRTRTCQFLLEGGKWLIRGENIVGVGHQIQQLLSLPIFQKASKESNAIPVKTLPMVNDLKKIHPDLTIELLMESHAQHIGKEFSLTKQQFFPYDKLSIGGSWKKSKYLEVKYSGCSLFFVVCSRKRNQSQFPMQMEPCTMEFFSAFSCAIPQSLPHGWYCGS